MVFIEAAKAGVVLSPVQLAYGQHVIVRNSSMGQFFVSRNAENIMVLSLMDQ